MAPPRLRTASSKRKMDGARPPTDAPEREIFSCRGPLHLTVVDWDNEHHRRSVTATLSASVYMLECDRQENRDPSQAFAPPWYEFFHFHAFEPLIDDVDSSIFGAIFEYNPNPKHKNLHSAPHYIVAFRGTLTKRNNLTRDLELDLHIIRCGLHKTTRAYMGVQAVHDMLEMFAEENIKPDKLWITGHSLGAAMAILAGKEMVFIKRIRLETFLFNSPFGSVPIQSIKATRVRHGLRFAGSLITAGLALALSSRHHDDDDNDDDSDGDGDDDGDGDGDGEEKEEEMTEFEALSTWVPKLHVHPADHICAEYIGYFEHRERMEKMGAGRIERLATQHSIGSLVLTAAGREADPVHLLPSASLTVNLAPAPDLKKAHALRQWWLPEDEVNYKTKVYMFT